MIIEKLVEYLNPSKSPKVGDRVRVVGNSNNHTYQIEGEYFIIYLPQRDHRGSYTGYVLTNRKNDTSNISNMGGYIEKRDFVLLTDSEFNKAEFIKELENIIEFTKDFDFDKDKDFATSYKVFNIFKEIKSASTDAEKLETIARYIK